MRLIAFFTLGLLACSAATAAQDVLQLGPVRIQTNREALLPITAPAGQLFRLETSSDLLDWGGLATILSARTNLHTDSAAPFFTKRFYRATAVSTNSLTGDHLQTTDGEVTLHPVNHASLVMTWKDVVIYCDPVGGASQFQGLPKANLILVTHGHNDHFEAGTINAVKSSNAVLVTPDAVYNGLSSALKTNTIVLMNGASTNLLGVAIEAVPAYNLTANFHPKGTGNGYVFTIGGKRIYVSGDTEDVPELRSLPDIDVAFVCMNLPYTMSVEKAADAVRAFKPKVAYVYHYRGYSAANVAEFKEQVGTNSGTEVRLRKWY